MVLASRGVRDLDEGTETVESDEERLVLRAQARQVWIRTWALAVLGTAVIYFLPL